MEKLVVSVVEPWIMENGKWLKNQKFFKFLTYYFPLFTPSPQGRQLRLICQMGPRPYLFPIQCFEESAFLFHDKGAQRSP